MSSRLEFEFALGRPPTRHARADEDPFRILVLGLLNHRPALDRWRRQNFSATERGPQVRATP